MLSVLSALERWSKMRTGDRVFDSAAFIRALAREVGGRTEDKTVIHVGSQANKQ